MFFFPWGSLYHCSWLDTFIKSTGRYYQVIIKLFFSSMFSTWYSTDKVLVFFFVIIFDFTAAKWRRSLIKKKKKKSIVFFCFPYSCFCPSVRLCSVLNSRLLRDFNTLSHVRPAVPKRPHRSTPVKPRSSADCLTLSRNLYKNWNNWLYIQYIICILLPPL